MSASLGTLPPKGFDKESVTRASLHPKLSFLCEPGKCSSSRQNPPASSILRVYAGACASAFQTHLAYFTPSLPVQRRSRTSLTSIWASCVGLERKVSRQADPDCLSKRKKAVGHAPYVLEKAFDIESQCGIIHCNAHGRRVLASRRSCRSL